MAVPSFLFLAFAALVAAIHGLSWSRRWRAATLLVANVAFLLSFSHRPLELAPYAAFLGVGYALVRLVGARQEDRTRAIAVAAIVVAFLWLKRYSFLPGGMLMRFDYETVGLSYVFFRVLNLAVAARDDPATGSIGPIRYVNYTLSFPALVSGPIQSFEDYRRMTEDEPAPLDIGDVGIAIERIVTGLFQFTVMATLASTMRQEIAGLLAEAVEPMRRAVLTALLTALYPIFLFFNFAGYTSVVIGVARFLRIELPENFDRPFQAASFIEYWSRWHMSLSNWLKTHVYNPLLLNAARRATNPGMVPLLNVGALFVTFFLIGLWHGPTWHFVTFGVLNGAGVAANQFYRIGVQRRLGTSGFLKVGRHPAYLFLARGITFAWVAFTLLWFWSDWPELDGFAAALGPSGIALAAALMTAGACVVIALLLSIRHAVVGIGPAGRPLVASRYLRTVVATLMMLAVVAVNVVTAGDAGDVVYKKF